jgi:signal transduction histidine kinase
MAENIAELPEKFTNDIQMIRRNVQLEARLIDDLLDLTRISTGKIELHLQRADAHAVARDALNIAKSDIHEKASASPRIGPRASTTSGRIRFASSRSSGISSTTP